MKNCKLENILTGGGGAVVFLNGEYKEEEKQTKVKFSFFRIIVTWNA